MLYLHICHYRQNVYLLHYMYSRTCRIYFTKISGNWCFVMKMSSSIKTNVSVACSVSDRQDSNFESFVWRAVSSRSSHHPQEAPLAQFGLYVHKGGLKPHSVFFISILNHYYYWERNERLNIKICKSWS